MHTATIKYYYVIAFLIILVHGKDIEELPVDAKKSDTAIDKFPIISTNKIVKHENNRISDNLEIRFNPSIISHARNYNVYSGKRCLDNDNEEYIECGKKCVLTCKYDGENRNARSSKKHQHICSKDNACIEGCFCKEGLVRHHGRCIRAEECPNRKCRKDEYYQCGSALSLTCDNYSIGKYLSTVNNKVECVWGCYCEKGYLRDNNRGKCVPINECSKQDILEVQIHVPGIEQFVDHDSETGNADNNHYHERPVKPNYSYPKPNHPEHEQRPEYGHQRPDYGQNKPNSGQNKPGYGYNKPPSYGQSKPPNYGQSKPPNYGQNKPPSYGQNKPPSYGQSKPPSYSQTKPPNYGQTKPPNYGQTKPPSYSQTKPHNYDQTKPHNYDQTKPNGYGKPPSYNQNRPPNNNQSNPPIYGQTKPHSYGQTKPPTYGITNTPGYGFTESYVDEHTKPSNYGHYNPENGNGDHEYNGNGDNNNEHSYPDQNKDHGVVDNHNTSNHSNGDDGHDNVIGNINIDGDHNNNASEYAASFVQIGNAFGDPRIELFNCSDKNNCTDNVTDKVGREKGHAEVVCGHKASDRGDYKCA